MEQKVINLDKGIRRNPTTASGGELIECMNLVSRNGEIVNAPVASEVDGVSMPEGCVLRYIHETAEGKVYVVEKDEQLTYLDADGEASETVLFDGAARNVVSVGDILIITGEDSMCYCLWENSSYTVLGSHIPELSLSFSLNQYLQHEDGNMYEMVNGEATKWFDSTEFVGKSVYREKDREGNEDGTIWFGTESSRTGKEPKETVSVLAAFDEAVAGCMSKYIELFTQRNKFIMPFLVRYAYKMYDGSNVMASAPILMVPNSGIVPRVQWSEFSDQNREGTATGKIESAEIQLESYVGDLELGAVSQTELDRLGKWKDIIKGVDIFVSRPFYRFVTGVDVNKFNVNGEYQGQHPICVRGTSDEMDTYFSEDILKYNSVSKVSRTVSGKGSTPIANSDWYGLHRGDSYSIPTHYSSLLMIPVPYKSKKEFEEEIVTCSNFYHIKYVPMADLSTTRTKVDIKDGVLSSLATQRSLEDEYQSHDVMVPECIKVLNGRLMMGNYKRMLFDGFNPYSMFAYSDGPSAIGTDDLYCVVYIRRNGKFYKVTSATARAEANFLSHPKFVYYPDTCAVAVEVHIGNVTKVYKMSEHEGLNGAYYFSGIDGVIGSDSNGETPEAVESDNTIYQRNFVCASNVNNPYVFEAKNYSKVGNGGVRALEVNTAALSQGQFGQHPLMAFTSDGVWAMEINGEGEYVSVQPISRDVILEGTMPLQTDNSIVFVTADSVKGVAGSEIKSISKELDGMVENSDGFFSLMTDWSELIKTESVLFHELLQGCKLMFDDANSLIHVYSPELEDVHYVMSIESGEWSRMTGGMPDSIVAGYPFSTVQYGSELYQYHRSTDDGESRLGLLLTRETSFDNPLAVKMLHWLRVMRKKQGDNLKVMVFVSEDRENWIRLKSFRAHSYKWYRFAIFTDMTDVDGIAAIVCGTEERRVNKPR